MKGFRSWDLYCKSEILRKQAHYLQTIQYYYYTIELFPWDRYFIEQYHDSDLDVIRITLASDLDMNKYLDKVSLHGLGITWMV